MRGLCPSQFALQSSRCNYVLLILFVHNESRAIKLPEPRASFGALFVYAVPRNIANDIIDLLYVELVLPVVNDTDGYNPVPGKIVLEINFSSSFILPVLFNSKKVISSFGVVYANSRSLCPFEHPANGVVTPFLSRSVWVSAVARGHTRTKSGEYGRIFEHCDDLIQKEIWDLCAGLALSCRGDRSNRFALAIREIEESCPANDSEHSNNNHRLISRRIDDDFCTISFEGKRFDFSAKCLHSAFLCSIFIAPGSWVGLSAFCWETSCFVTIPFT